MSVQNRECVNADIGQSSLGTIIKSFYINHFFAGGLCKWAVSASQFDQITSNKTIQSSLLYTSVFGSDRCIPRSAVKQSRSGASRI